MPTPHLHSTSMFSPRSTAGFFSLRRSNTGSDAAPTRQSSHSAKASARDHRHSQRCWPAPLLVPRRSVSKRCAAAGLHGTADTRRARLRRIPALRLCDCRQRRRPPHAGALRALRVLHSRVRRCTRAPCPPMFARWAAPCTPPACFARSPRRARPGAAVTISAGPFPPRTPPALRSSYRLRRSAQRVRPGPGTSPRPTWPHTHGPRSRVGFVAFRLLTHTYRAAPRLALAAPLPLSRGRRRDSRRRRARAPTASPWAVPGVVYGGKLFTMSARNPAYDQPDEHERSIIAKLGESGRHFKLLPSTRAARRARAAYWRRKRNAPTPPASVQPAARTVIV